VIVEIRDGSDERDSGKTFVPGETFKDVEPAPMPPLAPDGGVVPGAGIAPPSAAPAATPENFICLRGPCRHHWKIETTSSAGNPEGTFEALGVREPRQIHYICLVHPGLETDLTDDCAYTCTRWDPAVCLSFFRRLWWFVRLLVSFFVGSRKPIALEARRDCHYAAFPEHRPDEDEKTIADYIEDDEDETEEEQDDGTTGTEG
jgi:hypothetical protein